jgi:hypothetical protein
MSDENVEGKVIRFEDFGDRARALEAASPSAEALPPD